MAKRPPSKTGERGIKLTPRGAYRVEVSVGGRPVAGGSFRTLAEAVTARDALQVRQKAARSTKAQTNPVERSAAPRKDLGTVTYDGITKQRKRRPQFTMKMACNKKKFPVPVPQHTFALARFLALAMAAVAPNTLLYLLRTTPLAAKGVHTRGTIAEAVVRRILERRVLKDRGDDVRDREHDSHDLVRVVDGETRRVEVKAGRMVRDRDRWTFRASKVKPKLFDELILVFEGLDGLYVYAWGGKGLQGTEHAQEAKKGGVVDVGGDEHVLDPDDAHTALLVNLEAQGNTLLTFVPYDDPAFQDCFALSTTTEAMFARVPLGTLQVTSRGYAVEAIVATVLQRLGHHVAVPTTGQQSNGNSRGQTAAEYDRLVDGVKSEIKSSLLNWTDGKESRFRLEFKDVKAYEHSDRYLAWLTPKALHIWKQPKKNTAGLSGTGSTQSIEFPGPRGRDRITDPAEVEKYLLQKLAFNGLEYVARLDIGPGDFEAYEAAIEAKREMLGAAGGDAEDATAAEDTAREQREVEASMYDGMTDEQMLTLLGV
jgi:hypothetical protein